MDVVSEIDSMLSAADAEALEQLRDNPGVVTPLLAERYQGYRDALLQLRERLTSQDALEPVATKAA